jgi:hypothetical protein
VKAANIVTTRTKFSVFLLSVTLPINEFWQVFKESDKIVNPWFLLDYPLHIHWYLKFLCHNVSALIISLLVYRLSRMNMKLRVAASVYVTYCLFDLIMFFVRFNQVHYATVYAGLFLAADFFYQWYHGTAFDFIKNWFRSKAAKFIVSKTVVVKKKESIGA